MARSVGPTRKANHNVVSEIPANLSSQLDDRNLRVEGTENSTLRYQTPPPLDQAYEGLGLAPDGRQVVRFPGDHHTVVTAPLVADVAEAIDRAIRS